MDQCPDKETLIGERLDRLLTQYRESPNLKAIIEQGLSQIADVALALCDVPSHFEISDAIGDQLTLIGKRMGWPRCHCICDVGPTFGFGCGTSNPNQPIVGFCEGGDWADCQSFGTGDLCLEDDEVYRRYLLARRYQALQRYSLDDLQAAMRHIWGDSATASSLGGARVNIAPGRALTSQEQRELPLAIRVLPIAPGIQVYVDFAAGPIFGFGSGWAGFCDGAALSCPEPYDAYVCV